MLRIRWFLIVLTILIGLTAVPGFSRSEDASAPTQITGAVQSFSGNILDVKPATSPAVWVAIPDHLHVDRSAVKPGVQVSVDAHWADVCYIATEVTVQK
ncbi:MAG TPA: hypothetical protein VNV41_02960 [Candidatus Acidoferrales bacterium]|jgi:hypothetical protein|nr:hypothetical protein [Candidatus Acidoferrales bacterium]